MEPNIEGGIGGENGNNNNFKLKGPKGWVHGLKNRVKGTLKNAAGVAKEGRKKIYIAILLKVLVVLKFALPIILLLAAFNFVLTTEAHEVLVSSVDSYISNSANIQEDTKEAYESSGTLLYLKNDEIKEISNSYLKQLQKKNPSLYEAMSDEGRIGEYKFSGISYTNGFDITNAYEFILNSERMNFNRVEWKKLDRETGEISDLELQTDEETNLKYPKNDEDEEKGIKYFSNMLRPYMQSYIVASSMISGIATQDDLTYLGNFAFQIIDKGYHDVEVLQYTLQTAKRDQTKKHYITSNVKLDKYEKTRYCSYVDSETGETVQQTCTDYGYSARDLERNKEAARSKYKDAHANQSEIVDLYKNYDANVEKRFVYPIIKADVLKKFMRAEYEQTKYSDADVEAYTNSDESYISKTEEFVNVSGLGSYTSISSSGWTKTGETISVSIDSGDYITTKYVWNDKIKETYVEERNYEVDDVSEYINQIDKVVEVEQKELTEEEMKPGNRPDLRLKASELFETHEYNYYKELEDEKKLTRVDLINAVPSIYKEYLHNDEKYSKYIGYSRPHLSTSYNLLNKHLKEENISIKFDIEQSMGSNLFVGEIIGQNFIWPLGKTGAERITSCAGIRSDPLGRTTTQKKHGAMDIGAPFNYPIVASQSGTVYFVGPHNSYGNYIVLRHGESDGYVYYTLYAHMNSNSATNDLKLKKGDSVKAGQVIGYVGSTGDSTGAHLHFEIIQWPVSDNNGNQYLNYKKYNIEPIFYIQKDTIPDIVNNQGLPSNCGDMTSNDFGKYAATSGSTSVKKITKPSGFDAIDAAIDGMSERELLIRTITGEQGVGSLQDKVLVALSILNRAYFNKTTVNEILKGRYGNNYQYNAVTGNVFWGDGDSKAEEAINIAYKAIRDKTYKVNDVECISIYGFKGSNNKSSINDGWNNWNLLTVTESSSRGGYKYTGYYKVPSYTR